MPEQLIFGITLNNQTCNEIAIKNKIRRYKIVTLQRVLPKKNNTRFTTTI